MAHKPDGFVYHHRPFERARNALCGAKLTVAEAKEIIHLAQLAASAAAPGHVVELQEGERYTPSAPKLIVKACEARTFLGSRAMLLCDGSGEPLPGQTGVAFEQPLKGDIISITVEFAIDGKDIVLA